VTDASEGVRQLRIDIASCALGSAHGTLSRDMFADMVELIVFGLAVELWVRYS